jgi:hypothetical protein
MQVVSHDDVLRGTATVRVRRLDVLDKLKSNRDGHRETFEEALEGFHKAVVLHLTQALKDAKAGKRYTTAVHLPQPQDHTRDYDRTIAMLAMSLDEELELTSLEFAQFVLDDWGWKGDFITTASNYIGNN